MTVVLENGAAFRLEVDVVGKAYDLRDRFLRYHGADLLAQFLQEAGLAHGCWTFCIDSSVKSSGRSPPLQVRRVDPGRGGVVLWLKPGSNDSVVKGLLRVSRDHKGLSPELVHAALTARLQRAAVEEGGGHEDGVTHIPLTLDDTTVKLVLTAVAECQGDAPADVAAFLRALTARLDRSEDADVAYWLEAVESLVERGLLEDKRSHYVLTPAGHTLLGAAPPADAAAADLVIAAGNRLRQLLDLGTKLASLRDKRGSLRQQLDEAEARAVKLGHALAELDEEEAGLLAGVDVAALRGLLGGPQP